MAASLLIAGVEFSSWLERETLSVLDDLLAAPDTLAFGLNATNAAGATCPVPIAGSEVIYTTATGTRLFGGVLQAPEQDPAGFKACKYGCTCTDYRTFADRRRLNDRFVAQKPGAIAVALFAKYAPEFDTSLVDITNGPTITSIRFRRSDTITAALDKLASMTGFQWDINSQKQVIFGAAGTIAAPFGLADGSLNFSGLKVTIDRSQLANSVIVQGGNYPATTTTTDRFNGDTLTSTFGLSGVPFGLQQYVVFTEAWGSLNASIWTKTDVSNPSPPAGHIASDGYIFTTIQQGSALAESGKLQIVGGDGTWGDSRVVGGTPIARGSGTRFEFDVYCDGGGNCRVGLWNPNNTAALAGEQHGVYFNAGTCLPSEGGTSQAPANSITYTLGHVVRVRIVPGATIGASTWCNTNDAAGFPSSSWTLLYTSVVGSLAQFALVPCFQKDFIGRIGRIKVLNPLYGMTLTVGGTAKTVGLLNVDEDGGVDALVGLAAGNTPQLAFFGDTIPGTGTANVVLTYNQAIPVLAIAQDAVSIAAIKAIENPLGLPTTGPGPNGADGVYEGFVTDLSLDSLDLGYRRAAAELALYSNPLVSIEFVTYTAGLAAGQILPVALTTAGSGRNLSGQFLIQSVETRSLGSDSYAFTVKAGSRLKGVQEFLIALLMAGAPLETASDDGSAIDQITAANDSLVLAESFSIGTSWAGPYNYGDPWAFLMEDGVSNFLMESSGIFRLETQASTVALYGMSVYT